MTKLTSSSCAGCQPTQGYLTHGIAAAVGLAAAWFTGYAGAMIDLPAPPWLTVLSGVLVLVLASRRPPNAIAAAWMVVLAAGLMSSMAVGSSWAAATWLPVFLAVFTVAGASPAFLLAMTVGILVREAPTLVILYGAMGATKASGSSAYFAGFTGAVATPLWFALAARTPKSLGARVLSAMAVLVTALAVWSVLSSGSRAAALALIVAGLAYLVTPMLATRRRGRPPARTLAALVLVALLVPLWDAGLRWAFVGGPSTAAAGIERQMSATVEEVSRDGPTGITTRLALWRQAGTAMAAVPGGHGLGSYPHVIHAYQAAPMLWSGDPHSVWATAAVESGVVGLALLVVLVAGGAWMAMRRGSPALAALAAATVVMSLDVFASMPALTLLWWGALGAAWGSGPGVPSSRVATWFARAGVVLVVCVAAYLALRFSVPCAESCDPLARYGGHPKLARSAIHALRTHPIDPSWARLRAQYPYAFSLGAQYAVARAPVDRTAGLELVRQYPYHGAGTYLWAAELAAGDAIAADIAACGLVRIFGGQWIWRDWRSSEAELAAQRTELERLSTGVPTDEDACARAGIPPLPVGLR